MVIADDIFGDGVNIASRLERQAMPDGICIAEAAYASLPEDWRRIFEDGGSVRLRNISKAVRVWHWPRAPAQTTTARTVVAILPFRTLGETGDQSYFADGFTEDVIGGLARFRSLSVIAAPSTFAFRDRADSPAEIGRKLAADYLVSGDLRRSVGLRISVRLTEAATGSLIWSEKYDRRDADIFDIQDDIVRMVVSHLVGQIESADYGKALRKPPGNLAAYEFYLRGLVHLRGYAPDDNIKALEMFEAAVARDPSFALAHAYLALSRLAAHGYARATIAVLRDCTSLARKAISLDEGEAGSHRVLALALLYLKDFDGAERELPRACALNPSDANALVQLGGLLARRIRIDEAMPWIDEEMRLNPFPPHWYHAVLGNALYLKGKYEDALAALRQLPNPGKFTWARIVACLNRAGRTKEAVTQAAALLAEHPDFAISEFLMYGVVVESNRQLDQFRKGLEGMRLPQ